MADRFFALILFTVPAILLLYKAVASSDLLAGAISVGIFLAIYYLSTSLKEISFGEKEIEILETITRKRTKLSYPEIESVTIYQQQGIIRPATHLYLRYGGYAKPITLVFPFRQEPTCAVVVREFEEKLGKNKILGKRPEWAVW